MVKVLVVEDQVNVVLVYRMALAKSGYELRVARSVAEATKLLHEEPFEVVITDWMMPGQDGIELIMWIRANLRPAPPVVMVTALGLPDAARKAIDAGADEYLVKPIIPEQLLSVLARALNRQNKKTEAAVFGHRSIASSKEQNMYAVAIAAGSGSGPVLQHVLRGIGPSPNAAILVVAHGPGWAVEALAQGLSQEVGWPVTLASDGKRLEAGKVVVAPGDFHMIVDRDGLTINLDRSEPENFVRPSADPLMRSVARVFGHRSAGVILGGIGCDGSVGAGFIHTAGGRVLVLDPAETVVPQMSERVMEIGMADRVLKAQALIEILRHL